MKQRITLFAILIFLMACAADSDPFDLQSLDDEATDSDLLSLEEDEEVEDDLPSVEVEETESNLPVIRGGDGEPADLVLHNGVVYTVNEAQPWAETVAVKDGVIVFVGSTAEAEAWIGAETEVVDLNGRFLMPGFQDPHVHVLEAGFNDFLCFFSEEIAAAPQFINELRECAIALEGEPWVLGAGVDMEALLDLDLLPIEIIDEAIPDRPALVIDRLGHGAWGNSLAMQAVGYDTMTADPPGGVLVIDPETELFTGVVLENAQQALRTAAFPPTPENVQIFYESLLEGMATLAQNGVTTVSDAGGYWTRGHHLAWQQAEQDGLLTVRASNALYVFPDLPFEEQLNQIISLYSNDPDSLVRFNQVKIYIDGIANIGTSAVYEPYLEEFFIPGLSEDGFLYFDTETLNAYVSELTQAGFQLHFHVTGDRATGLALDAIEQAESDNRHRLTHLYFVHPDDFSRFVDLGVIADFQFAPSSLTEESFDDLGIYFGDRLDYYLPAFDMIEAGVDVVFSSDWDADSLSPFEKIAFIQTFDAPNRPDLATTIRMMTLDVAYLLHHEDKTGSVEVGKLADLIVLDRNLFDVSAAEVGETAVLLTLLGGNEVYRADNFSR